MVKENEYKLDLRQKILLFFLASNKDIEFDPIKMMKGLFLFAMETPPDWIPVDGRYQFEPYDYGPCSFQVYNDLNLLKKLGYIKSREAPGYTWEYYSLAPQGEKLVNKLKIEMDNHVLEYLGNISNFVSKYSMRSLLEMIYRVYPKYTVNSIFKF
jgi:hypothetical protein